jgi:threonine aldolase
LFGKPAALFVPTGVMGNQLAIKAHTSPGNEVIVDAESHIFNYETAAPSILSGVQLHCVPGEHGILAPAAIESAIRDDAYYFPPTTLVAIENTHNRGGGTIYPIETIRNISQLCKTKKLKLHIDGARLWNAHVATGVPMKEYGALADSVTVCFSKGLGAPVGSILCGEKDFIARAHTFRKIIGAGMRQVGVLAAAALYAAHHNVARLKEDHAKARYFSDEVGKIPAFGIAKETVQTNIVIIECVQQGKTPEKILASLKEEGVLLSHGMTGKIRAVFHKDVSMQDTEQAVAAFKKLFR